jgi:hypothetical protein
MLGGLAAGQSSASIALSIANRSLSRRIAIVGAAILCVMAFSPKLAAL